MPTSPPLADHGLEQSIVDHPSKQHPAAPLLAIILAGSSPALQQGRTVSEVILIPSSEGPCQFVANNRVHPATNWKDLTGEDGRLTKEADFDIVRNILFVGHVTTVVYRLKDLQVRCHYMGSNRDCRRIFIRIQPRVPPSLKDTFARFPDTYKQLLNASGMVVVCGPVGGGKSTLAASLVKSIAEEDRHVVTIEDPTEYWITPKRGLVTHREASFSAGSVNGRPPIDQVVKESLRSRLHALYIGETRDAMALKSTFGFSGAKEAVITTFHGGSISDCIIRMIALATEVMPEATAKLILSQRLHSIVYVNLAFNNRGEAKPVYMCLQAKTPGIRKIIAEGNPNEMKAKIDESMTNGSVASGSITGRQAYDEAMTWATAESITEALPSG